MSFQSEVVILQKEQQKPPMFLKISRDSESLNSCTLKKLFWQGNNIFRNQSNLFSLYFKEIELGNGELEWKLLKCQLWIDILFPIYVIIYCWGKNVFSPFVQKSLHSLTTYFKLCIPCSLGVFRALYNQVMKNSALSNGLAFSLMWPQ